MIRLKKLFLALLCVGMLLELQAAPITREQAQKRALDFLKEKSGSTQLKPVQNLAKLSPRHKAMKTTENELYYVFNRGNNEGYVIVSGDDNTRSVLGYTEEGEFDYASLPENMRFWLEGYENELLYISQHPESMAAKPNYAPNHEAIAPMVTTKWNQGDPYNQECPMYFTLGRSITGCVATAMAQVLYFQRAKSVTETQAAMPSYTTRTSHATYGKLNVEGIPAGSPIDWDNMLDSYGSGATAKQKLAVAQLMHYCGVSVEMDYTNSSSGAYSYAVADAMKKYFGYGSSVKYVYKDNGYNDDSWDALLYKELAEGRPFYLSGANSSGGHAFVGDGYDGNGCYHINWGWGGSSDGYFVLSKLNPSSQGLGGSSGGYSDGAEAVIGCEPENYLEKAMPIANATVKKLCIAAWDANGDGVFSFGEAAMVTNLGDVFKGQATITTFAELYNFTNLTHIADDAFNGCTKLNTVKLPKALKSIGRCAFANCRALKTFALHDNITSIGDSAFANCRVLPNLSLPAATTRIEANTFENCVAFTAIEIPLSVKYIGKEAFKGCTKLMNVTVKSVMPKDIVLGADVFSGIDLSKATLNTLQGTRSYFANAEQWKEFGNLIEERNLSQGNFAKLETNKAYYIYNVGTGYYLTKGEAYGTQAVVADTDEPMRFEFRRTSSMADGVYYLYSDDTGNSSKKYLFRTNTDSKIGSGVNACFVDGSLSNKTYWQVMLASGKEDVYTLQIPSNLSGYKFYEFLGVQPSHESNAASPTYGIYSDITYAEYEANCQWMLVPYDKAKSENYKAALQLKNLLSIGKTKRIDMTREQAVYDNFDSPIEEIEKAIRTLRKKLGFINFVDTEVRNVAVVAYDSDGNGEISYTEAASIESIDAEFNGNTLIKDLSDLQYFTGANDISGNSFKGCTSLERVILPSDVVNIYYRAFMGCSKLETIEIGSNVTLIGNEVFSGCKKLKEVRLAVTDPSYIDIGDNVFYNVTLSNVILYVPYGSKKLYEKADVWKQFGEIREMRAVQAVEYSPLTENKDVYVLNLDMLKSISKGEAYGTQAVVALNGAIYQLKRSSSMAEGVYYLSSSNGILFRTDTDTKVGDGIKTCFADGSSVSSKAYWKVMPVAGKENVYTFQVPSTDATYTEGEYLGTDYYHSTNAANGTYGLYWDVRYSSNTLGCQWAFIGVDEVKAAQAFFALSQDLKLLLDRADAKGIEATAEHNVYDNFESTEAEINEAILSLRNKLHYIDFVDSKAKTTCLNAWDQNEDDEFSLEEAAAVTDIGTTFRSVSLKSLDELQYFTGISEIPGEAFKSCSSMVSLYIPAGVQTIGANAFTSCSKLKYIALPAATAVVDATSTMLPSTLKTFVPKNQMEAYGNDATWGQSTIEEFTGIPTVTADDASRIYGKTNSKFTYNVTGAPVNGEPTLTCTAEATTPVGDYEITVEPGTITTPALVTVSGKMTVERAPLNIIAKSYTRNKGEENPTFEVTYRSFKNREKADVLIQQPTIECDATPESPAGVYEIRVYGAEAQNYEITYENGTLTVLDPDGIQDIDADTAQQATYDLQGRRVAKPTRGLYIVGKKKQVIK